ncbi:MAG: 5'-nucleotidase C-terminal domain-containing protein, partial [Phascolarctobacterium sp.]
YSERMLQYMIMPNNLESFSRAMSGEQLEQMLRLYVEGVPNANVYNTVKTVNYHGLPITSGLSYTVKQENKAGSFKLQQVLVNGKPLEKQKQYRVTILDKRTFFGPIARTVDVKQGLTGFTRGKHIVRREWLDYFKAGKALLAPTSYVRIVGD